MGSPKAFIDETQETLSLIDKVIKWASKRLWSRQLLIAGVGLLVSSSIAVALSTRWSDLEERRESHSDEYALLAKEINDQEGIDYLQLCIDAEKNRDPNKDYYCNTAVNIYRSNFVDTPNSDVEKNIQLSAYGAMKADTAKRLRSTTLARFNLKRPKMSEGDRFLLRWGIWIMFSAVAFSMLGLTFLVYRAFRARQL